LLTMSLSFTFTSVKAFGVALKYFGKNRYMLFCEKVNSSTILVLNYCPVLR